RRVQRGEAPDENPDFKFGTLPDQSAKEVPERHRPAVRSVRCQPDGGIKIPPDQEYGSGGALQNLFKSAKIGLSIDQNGRARSSGDAPAVGAGAQDPEQSCFRRGLCRRQKSGISSHFPCRSRRTLNAARVPPFARQITPETA